jgi:hypothetical protein
MTYEHFQSLINNNTDKTTKTLVIILKLIKPIIILMITFIWTLFIGLYALMLYIIQKINNIIKKKSDEIIDS